MRSVFHWKLAIACGLGFLTFAVLAVLVMNPGPADTDNARRKQIGTDSGSNFAPNRAGKDQKATVELEAYPWIDGIELELTKLDSELETLLETTVHVGQPVLRLTP